MKSRTIEFKARRRILAHPTTSREQWLAIRKRLLNFFMNKVGQIFHTYSPFSRGSEEFLGIYRCLARRRKGRNENGPAARARPINHWRLQSLSVNLSGSTLRKKRNEQASFLFA